jgi:hypothetical protein
MEADQRHNNDVRPGRHLRDGEHVGELAVAHPAHHVDRDAMDLRDRRVGAADREQR